MPWTLHNTAFNSHTRPEDKQTSGSHFKGGGNSEKLCKLPKGKQLGMAALGLILDWSFLLRDFALDYDSILPCICIVD